MRAYVGDRANRRHKPGRALERTVYRFDVLADYGAFRDLQRHRMLTIEWQALTPHHGYTRPEAVDAAGAGRRFDEAMERSAEPLRRPWSSGSRTRPSYAVSLAYKVRFVMQMNAREAMHLIELRTTPQGHPAYRLVGQEMHRLHRRGGRPPRRRRDDALRRPHARARARATRRRASGRGPPPGRLSGLRTWPTAPAGSGSTRTARPAGVPIIPPAARSASARRGLDDKRDDMADDDVIDDEFEDETSRATSTSTSTSSTRRTSTTTSSSTTTTCSSSTTTTPSRRGRGEDEVDEEPAPRGRKKAAGDERGRGRRRRGRPRRRRGRPRHDPEGPHRRGRRRRGRGRGRGRRPRAPPRPPDGVTPKKANEFMCTGCFLLVNRGPVRPGRQHDLPGRRGRLPGHRQAAARRRSSREAREPIRSSRR